MINPIIPSGGYDAFVPHLHLQTTADLPENAEIPEILAELVEVLAAQPSFESPSIKAYHSLRANWVVGAGHPPGFAHLTVAILEGRPGEVRQAIGQVLMECLRRHFAGSLDAGEVAITLEVREMNRETYLR
jgi:5-carboxymethyl-2-hydroxymuconate isomerase